MKGLWLTLVVGVLALGGCFGSCNRPSEEDCRAAILNVRKLTGTEQTALGWDIDKAIRSCKGGSTKKAVKCMKAATTLKELQACDPHFAAEMNKAGRKADGTHHDDKKADDKKADDKKADDKKADDKKADDKKADDKK